MYIWYMFVDHHRTPCEFVSFYEGILIVQATPTDLYLSLVAFLLEKSHIAKYGGLKQKKRGLAVVSPPAEPLGARSQILLGVQPLLLPRRPPLPRRARTQQGPQARRWLDLPAGPASSPTLAPFFSSAVSLCAW